MPSRGAANLDALASSLEHIATVIALVVGAIFAYYKFIKDRIYRPRLDFTIDAGRLTIADRDYLLTRVSVKNLGVTKIQLSHADTGVLVHEYSPPEDDYKFSGWEAKAFGDLFVQHDWIESNETISDDALLRVPSKRDVAYYVSARVIVVTRSGPIECVGRRIIPGTKEWFPVEVLTAKE